MRFPATSEELQGRSCPRCGAALIAMPRPAAGETPASVPPSATVKRSDISLVGVLDNIRSIHNTGSMFRTADGAGLNHLYLCGITSTPDHPRLAKAALGAERSVAWSAHPNAVDLMAALSDDGYYIIALERIGDAESQQSLFDDWHLAHHGPVALVVGNEKAGVDPAVLPYCSQLLRLPMLGHKSSLNAAVAFGIAAYQLRFGLRN